MDPEQRSQRRVVFDEVPDLYDSARPAYPPRLFDDLFAWLGKDPHQVRIVEMGAGTGKGTIPLLQRGSHVTAVELGSSMADYLKQKTSEFGDRVDVIIGAFEEVDLSPHTFDIVFAATAWHWLDPAVGLRVAHSLLKKGGTIALLEIIQVSDESEPDFFEESQSIYRELGLDKEPWVRPPQRASVVNKNHGVLEKSPLFTDVTEFRVNWDLSYTTSEYVNLKLPHSDTRLLTEPTRKRFLSRIANLIDQEFAGRIVRPGVACLCAAKAN